MDLAQGISAGIEQFCRCQFPRDYIAEGKLMCNLEALHTVLFQGRIISTNDRGSSVLVGDMDGWVSTEPTVVVQGELLRVVKSETQPNSSSEDSQLSSAVVGAVVAAVLVLLLLITVIVVSIAYIRWRNRKKDFWYDILININLAACMRGRQSCSFGFLSSNVVTMKSAKCIWVDGWMVWLICTEITDKQTSLCLSPVTQVFLSVHRRS